MPRISVVVASYNAASYLPYALQSVLDQSYPDWEVIIVDDGSTDDTREIVERFMPAFSGRLRYSYQENRGVSPARNATLEHVTGEFIALLDADDIWLPHRLARQLAVLDAQSNIGLIHGKVARINARNEVIEYPPPPPAKYLSGKIASHLYTRRAHILSPTVTLRSSCLEQVGRFDEQMSATEDRDLWFRIAQCYEVAYLPEILAHYRISPNSLTRSWERMYKAQLYFALKHYESGACNRRIYREAVGNIYRERGDVIFKNGGRRESLSWYARAAIISPATPENIYMFGRALAEPVLSRVRSLRNSSNTAPLV